MTLRSSNNSALKSLLCFKANTTLSFQFNLVIDAYCFALQFSALIKASNFLFTSSLN